MYTDRILSSLLRKELRLRESAARVAADDLDAASALTAEANEYERRAKHLADLLALAEEHERDAARMTTSIPVGAVDRLREAEYLRGKAKLVTDHPPPTR
ncbi:hypothetical protein [Limnoglobus roseus]|uniref:Uncharacterized protein n=1 Tax=Limnoglobus roseus TaxID=2598579 RepID=A0A5C1A658_9BACT|nr:hypothetical protein [Limnoglobus roseus]QEL14631.1 hypothetical protein PX52LOC_01523 [Limnoglobus roseus]